MRIIKDRIRKDVGKYEILCSAFDHRKKIIAAGGWQEPIFLYKYPYMKLFKKIIHRERIFLTDQDLLHITDESKVFEDDAGNRFRKGQILTPDHIIFTDFGQNLVIAYRNGEILVYDTVSWKKKWDYRFSGRIGSIQLVRNEKTLFISTEDWFLYEIDTTTWNILQTKSLPDINKGKVIATKDLDFIYVILDRKRIAAYNYETLEEIHTFQGHTRGINKILLSPDESLLVSSGMDCKLSVFDVNTGDLLSYLIGHSDEVYQFEFDPKGQFIMSSSEDETLKLWSLRSFKCIRTVARVPNALTMQRYGNMVLMGNVKGELRTFKIA